MWKLEKRELFLSKDFAQNAYLYPRGMLFWSLPFFFAEDLMRKLNLLIPIAAYVSRLGFLWVWCGWRTGTQPCLLQIAESRKVFQTLAGQPVSLCWRGSLHLVRARHKRCSGKSVPRLCGRECVSVSEQKPAQFRSRNDVRRQLSSDQGMTSNVI